MLLYAGLVRIGGQLATLFIDVTQKDKFKFVFHRH